MHLNDSRYALIEFKLGQQGIDDGAKHFNKIEELCINSGNTKPPDLKIIITATQFAYKIPDDVFVVHIGCIKD